MKKLIASLLKKDSGGPLLSVDIGTSSIKVMQMDNKLSPPRLMAAGSAPTPAGAMSNHTVTHPEAIGKVLRAILEANEIQKAPVVVSIPGTCVFSKKIKTTFSTLKDLALNIEFEAANYIPHSVDAVYFDFQVVNKNEKGEAEVLLVAVKREIVDGFLNAVRAAGLDEAIVDVDYFALENMFELSYPEEREKTVALVNFGARYTGVNILSHGRSIVSGDISVGSRLYTDALCETLKLEPRSAELAKAGQMPPGVDGLVVLETLDRTTEHVASELQRQLGFLWNAASTDETIEAIYLCGGGSQVKGLVEALSAKTGICCQLIETLRGVQCGDDFDPQYLEKIAPSLGVSVGLASRRLGDKQHAIS